MPQLKATEQWIAAIKGRTLCVNISRTQITNLAMHLLSEQDKPIPAHVQLNQEPYGLHTLAFNGWGGAPFFLFKGENTPDQL